MTISDPVATMQIETITTSQPTSCRGSACFYAERSLAELEGLRRRPRLHDGPARRHQRARGRLHRRRSDGDRNAACGARRPPAGLAPGRRVPIDTRDQLRDIDQGDSAALATWIEAGSRGDRPAPERASPRTHHRRTRGGGPGDVGRGWACTARDAARAPRPRTAASGARGAGAGGRRPPRTLVVGGKPAACARSPRNRSAIACGSSTISSASATKAANVGGSGSAPRLRRRAERARGTSRRGRTRRSPGLPRTRLPRPHRLARKLWRQPQLKRATQTARGELHQLGEDALAA